MSDALRTDEYSKTSYTYADYLEWEGQERYELINGEAYMMASPTVAHQRILMGLSLQFGNWLSGKPCEVFSAPLDVRLFPKKNRSDSTVVQPDLLVVCTSRASGVCNNFLTHDDRRESCDSNKLSNDSVNGSPDMVIEIFSELDTYSYSLRKFACYLEAGVREYWIVDSETKKVIVNFLDNGYYIGTFYDKDASIPVSILPGLKISLKNL